MAEGTATKAAVEGYRIGGKTATSEKLPRRSGKYIASFMTFAPADDPRVMVFLMVDEPQGVYYGGTVGGPAMKEMLENILPYLGIPKEGEIPEDAVVTVPDVTGMTMAEAKNALWQAGLTAQTDEGETVVSQLPPAGQEVNRGTKVLLYGT
ncbi:MAG: PASTA domain-containing protein [Anaerotignum sp.]|nr:PASTA domain-containing protein [Anaerotignum sp.]MEE0700335.1 PASTA domain-containing protein [Anaerotignum sp.]